MFVRLDYFLPNFRRMAIAYDVPFVVSPAFSSTFDQHVLSIEAKMENAVMTSHRSTAEDDRFNTGTAFFLTQDLPALCNLLRMAALQTRMYFNCIETPRGVDIMQHYTACDGYVLRLRFEVRQSVRGAFDEKSQSNLLQDLSTVRGGVRVSFHGFATTEALGVDTVQVAQSVHPSMVWIRAWDWDRLEWLMRWKKRAEAIASSKSLHKLHLALLAVHQISEIWAPFDSLIRMLESPDPDVLRVREYHPAIKIDVALTNAQLNIAYCSMEIAGRHLNFLKGSMSYLAERGQLSGQTRRHWIRIRLALGLVEYIRGEKSRLELIDLVDEAEEASTASSQDCRLMHDVVFAKKLIARTDSEEGLDTMKVSCSVEFRMLGSPTDLLDRR